MAGNPLCHFEFNAGDVEKTKEFYSKVFNWRFEPFPGSEIGYILIRTGAEPEGGLMQKPEGQEAPNFQVYFLVENIEATLEQVKEAGGDVLVGRTPIPNVGFWAMFKDLDSIHIGIFEAEKK